MPTIAEEQRIREKTNGNPFPDSKTLFEKLLDYSIRSNYDFVIEIPDCSNTTFNPLKVPLTIDEAKERYISEGKRAIDPGFIDLVNKVKDYNFFCECSEGYKEKLRKIEVTGFMNFLYLAEEVIKGADYHERIRKKRIFRRKKIEVDDPNPIIVLTNPQKDGLLNVLKQSFTTALVGLNRGLRVFYYGDVNEESLRELYFNEHIKDFDFIKVNFDNPADEYFGIWIRTGDCIEGKFLKKSDLLGIENRIKGEFLFGGKINYELKLERFNKLKRD